MVYSPADSLFFRWQPSNVPRTMGIYKHQKQKSHDHMMREIKKKWMTLCGKFYHVNSYPFIDRIHLLQCPKQLVGIKAVYVFLYDLLLTPVSPAMSFLVMSTSLCDISFLTIFLWPLRHAATKGVVPETSDRFGSAPFRKSKQAQS